MANKFLNFWMRRAMSDTMFIVYCVVGCGMNPMFIVRGGIVRIPHLIPTTHFQSVAQFSFCNGDNSSLLFQFCLSLPHHRDAVDMLPYFGIPYIFTPNISNQNVEMNESQTVRRSSLRPKKTEYS